MLKNFKETQKVIGSYIGGERPKGDFYATCPIAVEKLLESEKFGNLILEPCCGDGAISKILESKGHNVISSDLYDWGYSQTGIDFLESPITNVDAVVTNPPFNLSLQFAEKALKHTERNKGKVAMLNRLQWLEGVKRGKLFKNTPLSKVLVFSRRIPRMHRFDFTGKPGTSLLCFAWFIWDWQKVGNKVEIDWI